MSADCCSLLMMVAGISVSLDSSEDEDVVGKRRSTRQKFVESEDEATDDSNIILKAFNHIDSNVEPDREPSKDPRCGSIVVKEMPFGEVDTFKKKWKILLDSDCSSDEETPKTHLNISKNADESEENVGHNSQSHFSLMKESDLYDAEESEDEATPRHSAGNSLQSHFSVEKRELYDANGSEDEVTLKSKSKRSSKSKGRCVSERRSKSEALQQIHSETQRLVRESRVSLPYHKPCQRSLAEFLQRRHTSACSAAPLKISANDLGQVWNELEHREKDVEEFYKSDSDESVADMCSPYASRDGSDNTGNYTVTTGASTKILINNSVSEIGTSNSTNSSAVISSDDSKILIPGISGRADAPSGEAGVSSSNTDIYIEDTGAGSSVPNVETKSLSSSQAADNNREVELGQNQIAEDSSNFHLHYSESCSEDMREPALVTNSALHDDESNALDIRLEAANTEDLALHYTESSVPGGEEELQKQEKTTSWENQHLHLPDGDGDDNKAKTVLQGLARRSLPGLGDVSKLKPQLSGAPNGVIELDDEEPALAGVVKLVERYMKHSAAKKPAEKRHTVEVGCVSAEKGVDGIGNIHRDVVKVVLGSEEAQDDPALAKPGAKLRRLKEELQLQIAQRRADEWHRHLQEQGPDIEEEGNEKEDDLSDCGGLLDDLETETTDAETESEEEEDIVLVEKKRVKSAFLDDEAEVSDDDETSGDDEDEVSEGVANDMLEVADTRVKSTFRDDKADVRGDSSNEDDMLPAANIEEALSTSPRKTMLERAKTFDLFASQDGGGDSDLDTIPPYQPHGAMRKQTTPIVDRKKHILDLISPVSNLTSLRDSPSTQSPLTGQVFGGTLAGMSKKLFAEPDVPSTQDNMEELLGLCSGQFTGDIGVLVDPTMETGLEEELLGLCSGKFISQPVNLRSLEKDEERSQPSESPPESALALHSADDEEDEVVEIKARKRHRKLDFSDEESDIESEVTSDLPDVSETRVVDYDSEENEVVDPRKPRENAVAEFFEDEAELSESEWDSADEDEQGLDTMELEDGDAEVLDQHKVKEQLDRIYMRRLLDEDRQEVRLLQEILLEDGELHSEGGGRERKFRWRNTNNVDDGELHHQDSDNEGVEEVEIEDEELWRRMRHEREIFLQQQIKSGSRVDGVLSDELDSQLLKLGWAALKRINSQDPADRPGSIRETMLDILVSPDTKRPFKLLTKRGSFLARGENALARIADVTRTSAGGPSVGPKNSRNFVFATVSPEKAEESGGADLASAQTKKRKQDLQVTPRVVKRLRISDEHSRGRKLLDLLM
ncbi:claspin isoform X3 [Zootermopsis nevadensis]|uniref:claspin isoform X3 n=1 Tax=Zootermopsis nevadensis TaxID=136037 RepID=UPI000B8EE866|nr:claspin isoform X3 [Zootermopsis nevadensis]